MNIQQVTVFTSIEFSMRFIFQGAVVVVIIW